MLWIDRPPGVRQAPARQPLPPRLRLGALDLVEQPVAPGADLRDVAARLGIDQPVALPSSATRSNGWTRRPDRNSGAHSAGVRTATPWPATAARPSICCESRRIPGRASRSSTTTPASANHCCHQISAGLSSGNRSRSAGFANGPARRRSSGLHSGVKRTGNRRCMARPGQGPVPWRMAASTSSRAKSTSWSEVDSRSASVGCASWKPPSRGPSQLEAIECAALIVSTPVVSARTAAKALRSVSNASVAAADSRRPELVSVTCRGCRTNSNSPSRSSSSLTW